MSRAIFLDRDGVINVDRGYVCRPEDFVFFPGALEALLDFQKKGYLLIIVTNQSGIGRGYYTLGDFEHLMEWMKKKLSAHGIFLHAIYFCPHHPSQECDCRKPKPGMILRAAKDFGIDLKNSWMIGDKPSDIKAGLAAGVGHTILIGDIDNDLAEYKAQSLFDTIKIIKQECDKK